VLTALLLVAGYWGFNAATQPTLTLSPATVHVGDQVVVHASRVPANQVGDIQLRGTPYSFPFRADMNGNVTETLAIPSDTPIDDVMVRICWSGTCHAQATLHVIAAGSSVAPSPSQSTGPLASPSPPSTVAPTAAPAPAPTSAPQPRPTSAPQPPPPPPAASISLSSKSIPILTGSVTVYGLHFGAGKAITITFTEGALSKQFFTTAASDGSFTKLIFPQAVTPGQATITACDSSNVCASQPITVTAT